MPTVKGTKSKARGVASMPMVSILKLKGTSGKPFTIEINDGPKPALFISHDNAWVKVSLDNCIKLIHSLEQALKYHRTVGLNG